MISSRRAFLTGLSASIVAVPAIVRFASLMPVRGIVQSSEDIYREVAQQIMDARFLPFVFWGYKYSYLYSGELVIERIDARDVFITDQPQ